MIVIHCGFGETYKPLSMTETLLPKKEKTQGLFGTMLAEAKFRKLVTCKFVVCNVSKFNADPMY